MRANGKRISRYPPYGYRFNGQGWIEDEREQRAVAIMRQLRAEGLSLRQISAELERQGHHNRRGRRLSAQMIFNVLNGPESLHRRELSTLDDDHAGTSGSVGSFRLGRLGTSESP